jgi:hypothetical protein
VVRFLDSNHDSRREPRPAGLSRHATRPRAPDPRCDTPRRLGGRSADGDLDLPSIPHLVLPRSRRLPEFAGGASRCRVRVPSLVSVEC